MNKQMKIGIALSGGGLQGFAHIGALKALEDLGINNIKYISGTSTGSIVASLYAMGYNTNEIEKIWKENYKKILKIKKRTIIKMVFNYILKKKSKTEGLIDGKVVEDLVNKQAIKKDIRKIKEIKEKKLAIATVDTKSIKECIFVSNNENLLNENVNYITDIDVGKAVRASMAFPGIFTTLNYKEYNFIDGGTIDNLPTKILKDMGADKIIAIGFDISRYNPSDSFEDVVIRALDIFSYNDVKKGQEIADVSIEIYNSSTSLLNIKDIETTIKNGYNSVMNNKEKIYELIKKGELQNV